MPKSMNQRIPGHIYGVALFSSPTAVGCTHMWAHTDSLGRALHPLPDRPLRVEAATRLLVEAVLGAVVGTLLPVVVQVVVPHQTAQDEEELIKADLVVLVLVCSPEQLRDVVGLLPALRRGRGSPINPGTWPTAKGRASTACVAPWHGPATRGLQQTAHHSGRGQGTLCYGIRLRGGDMAGTSASWPQGCVG